MKIYKALKLKKRLVGEINKLQQQINSKNSYLEGADVKFDTHILLDNLIKKQGELVNLKMALYEGNRGIQKDIFLLSELKSRLSFLTDLNTTEGEQGLGAYSAIAPRKYKAQIGETENETAIVALQEQIDFTQEKIDSYNYTTDIQI